jgi:hypothetical protein
MSLAASVSNLSTFPAGVPVSLAALRRVSQITVTLSGTIGNPDLSTTAVKNNVTVPDAYWFAQATLSAGVYLLSLNAGLTSYTTGLVVAFRSDPAGSANSGAVDLNVNSLGAKDLLKENGRELEAGDIPAGYIVTARYNGTAFQVLSVTAKPMRIRAGTSGGSASANTLTLTPSTLTLSDLQGVEIEFTAGFAPTGAVTLQVNGLLAKSIVKHGSQAVVAQDWAAGQILRVVYDGTNFQLLTPIRTSTTMVWGDFRELVVEYASANTVTISAHELVVKSSDGTAYLLSSVSETADITVSGAGGLDTGVELANSFYYIYVIYNPTTGDVSSLLSLNRGAPYMGPTLPSGYTHYALVGIARNSAGNFLNFRQRGRNVWMPQAGYPIAASSNWETADFSQYVPDIAKTIRGYVGNTTAGDCRIAVSGSSTGAFGVVNVVTTAATTGFGFATLRSAGTFEVECPGNGMIYVLSATGTTYAVLTGYTW